MQKATRSNADNTLVQVEDPEQIIRVRRRSMAEQTEQGRENPRDTRDSKGEEYSEAEEMNIRDLYVPDLNNTPLQRAIRNGMALNDSQTIYRIRCPLLKEYIGKDTLTVYLPEGRLEVPTDPPVDFMANCAPTPFDQPRLLIKAMQSLVQTQPELTILPGDDIPLVRDRYLLRNELIDRISNYVDLCVLYAESALRHESAQLHGDRDEILRKEIHEETLMQRISSNMDKLLAHMQRDIRFRKANKKIQYPTPKINPRIAPPVSAQEIRKMKDGLKDESRNIIQIAFLPEPEEGARGGPRITMPGEDIPDAPGRCREEERRSNLSINTNSGPTQGTQPCHTDRVTDRTVNFQDREHHRTNVISEVQQNLMNISNSQNSQDQANNANVRSDRSDNTEHQNPWPRNADHSRDNHSSDSSDTDSIGHWDSNWQNKKCTACGFHGHTYYSCEKKRKGELYCKRCNRYTHCDATCSRQCNSSTPRFQHQSHHSPRPDNHTIQPTEPNYNNYNYNNYNTRPSPAPSSTGSTADVTQQFMTFLDESRQQAKLLEYRKELLANISIFDGKDKKSCLMWLSQCAHTAVNTKMTLKEVLVAKGGPIVSTQVQIFMNKTPDATDAELKQHILESFSNVGSRTEAHHYLTRMTVDEDESLLAHNSEYAAVHEAAHGITPEEQRSELALMDYVRTLPQITCDELTKQISCPKSKIHNLRDAMNMAESLDRQGRQRELNRQERNALRETTIREETVNEMSIQEEVNFMTGRSNGHFNSTMKNNSGHWNNSPNRNNSYNGDRNNSYYGSRNNSYQGKNNSYSDYRSDRNNSDNRSWNNKSWNPRYNYSDNYDSRRRLNRYRHQPRDPKNNIRFEYNAKDTDIYSTLRNTVDHLKEHPQADRYKFKKMLPKVTGHRNREEVREDTIAEMKMEDLQGVLKEDVDLIFNALVLHDYIKEVDA